MPKCVVPADRGRLGRFIDMAHGIKNSPSPDELITRIARRPLVLGCTVPYPQNWIPMSKPQFSYQHLFDRGTATPCVARTMPQTRELAQAFLLDEKTSQVLMELSYEVMRHLIGCADIGERIRAEVREGRRRIAAGEVKIQAGGQVAELPSLGALQNDVEMVPVQRQARAPRYRRPLQASARPTL